MTDHKAIRDALQADEYLTATVAKQDLRTLLADLDAKTEALKGVTAELESVLVDLNNERMPHDGDEFHERLSAAQAALKGKP